jgi:Pyruvate/2-oxoacid:ferredoxin oxidoreductase delta subunit
MWMKGMIGMSEMTLQECIARLEDLIQDRKSFFTEDGDDDVFRTDAAALEKAVSMLHKIASGELKPVVHGEWLNFYNDFATAECSECGECYEVSPDEKPREDYFNAFKQFYKFCPSCGALMDEKDGAK